MKLKVLIADDEPGPERAADQTVVHNYETAFCVFMAMLAYLWRDNPEIVYPQILHLFLLLLTLNLTAGLSLRLWPSWKALSAGFILSNCAAITAILKASGGAESNLWVLYLLPIFSVCLLLDLREVVWITAGAIAFNATLAASEAESWTGTPLFALLVKSAIFILTAAIARKMAQRDRANRRRLERGRAELQRIGRILDAERERIKGTEKLADVGLMSSAVVHGLNNTLTALLGFVDIALQDDGLSLGLRDDLEGARLCALRGRDMLSAFSTLARGKRGPRQACDVRGIIGTALRTAEDILMQRGGRLLASITQELPPVRGDRVHLQRLVCDLAACAAKLTEAGETMTVRDAEATPDRLQLLIEISGQTIPEETVQALFKPLPGGQKEKTGLDLCAEIAVQHQGRLQAEAKPEGGVRFTLTLPASNRQPVPLPAGRSDQ